MFTWSEGYPSKRVNPVAGGQKKGRIYKENFTGRVTLQPGQLNAWSHLKGLETVSTLHVTRVGELTLPGVFTREKVNPPSRVLNPNT